MPRGFTRKQTGRILIDKDNGMSALDKKIIAWQYRKVDVKKEKVVWDSCGEYTYNKFKDDPTYEVRRLVVFDQILRGNN